MVEDDWRSWKMLIFDSPKPDILFPARDKLVRLDRAKLDGEDVEIADLLC
jgi:hypothetical protein